MGETTPSRICRRSSTADHMNDGKVATLWNGEFQYSMESFSIQLRASVFNWEFQYSMESFSIQWRASVFTWELQYSLESFSTQWRAPPRSRNSEQRSRRRTCRTESGRFSCVIASIFCDGYVNQISHNVHIENKGTCCRRQSSRLAWGCNPVVPVPSGGDQLSPNAQIFHCKIFSEAKFMKKMSISTCRQIMLVVVLNNLFDFQTSKVFTFFPQKTIQ